MSTWENIIICGGHLWLFNEYNIIHIIYIMCACMHACVSDVYIPDFIFSPEFLTEHLVHTNVLNLMLNFCVLTLAQTHTFLHIYIHACTQRKTESQTQTDTDRHTKRQGQRSTSSAHVKSDIFSSFVSGRTAEDTEDSDRSVGR